MKTIGILFVSLFLLHCGSSEVGNPIGSNNIASMDIVGAKALFVAPMSATLSRMLASSTRSQTASIGENTLFKITEDGAVLEVIYRDADGNEITVNDPPRIVYNVNSEYLMVVFTSQNDFFLVRKSDGAVFLVASNREDLGLDTPSISGGTNAFINSPPVLTDAAGNLYFSGDGKVVRVNIGNPESLTAEVLTPDTDSIARFAVADDGVVVYSGSLSGNSGSSPSFIARVRKTNGAFENLPSRFIDLNFAPGLTAWQGTDGKLTLLDESDCSLSVEKLLVGEDQNLSFDPYGTLPGGSDCLWVSPPESYLLRFGARTLVIRKVTPAILEFENETQVPREITTVTLANISLASDSDDHYYLSGEDADNKSTLLRVDPATDGVVPLTTPGDYQITAMAVSDDETVSFTALRFSDGARVVGEISPTGVITIQSSDLTGDVTQIIRLN